MTGARTYVKSSTPLLKPATPKTHDPYTPNYANYMRRQANLSPHAVIASAVSPLKGIPNKSPSEVHQENTAPDILEEINNNTSEILPKDTDILQQTKEILESNIFIFIPRLPEGAKDIIAKNVQMKLKEGGNISELVLQELLLMNEGGTEISSTEIAWLKTGTIGTTEAVSSNPVVRTGSNTDGHSNAPKETVKEDVFKPEEVPRVQRGKQLIKLLLFSAIAAGTLSVTGAFDLLYHTLGKKKIGDDAKEALEVWKAAFSGFKMLLLRSAKKSENEEKTVTVKELKTKKRLQALDEEAKEALSEAHALLNKAYQKQWREMKCKLDWTEFLKKNPNISEAYYGDFFGVAFLREIDEGKSVLDIANHVTKVLTEHLNKEEENEQKKVTLTQKMDGQFSKIVSGSKSTTERDD